MPPVRTNPLPRRVSGGFTLIEILSVIAVIGILAAILIPTLSGVSTSAKRAKTKVQFSQWATAIENFRQEYGYYPDFTTASGSSAFSNGLIDTAEKTARFVEALTGKKLNGDPLDTGGPGLTAGNTKRIAFCSFGPDDLSSAGRLQDAFKTSDPNIVVLIDKNYDGMIRFEASGGDYDAMSLPQVSGLSVSIANGQIIRAGVIFYSAGAGTSAADIVKSWE